jgi:hypothetical protein
MHTIVTHLIAFLVGCGCGAYLWNRYSAKAQADLAAVKAKL